MTNVTKIFKVPVSNLNAHFKTALQITEVVKSSRMWGLFLSAMFYPLQAFRERNKLAPHNM
jgi:hypothetical protein